MKGFWNWTSIIIPITLSFIFFSIYHSEDVLAAPPTRHLCRPEQRDALLALKNEFHIGKPNDACMMSDIETHKKTESWGSNSDCCSWKGITCNAKSGDVVELNLQCSFLHAQFHSNSSLQNLPFLTTLDLSCNDFNGQIPYSIANLSNLITLHLWDNNFSGRIPSWIGNLPHLTSLNLRRNNLVGEIPYSIGNLPHLTYLSLAINNLVGEIPYSIGNLSHLTSLNLAVNNFVGEIPSSFGNLNQLAFLIIDFNKLSGNFPIVLLNLTRLSVFSLSYNQFSGGLPPNITSLSNLSYFQPSHNAFTQTVPSSLFTIPSLLVIDLSFNQLNGTIEFGNTSSSPSNLEILSLGSNNFKGPILRSISKFVNLEGLDLSHLDTQGPDDFSIFSHLKSLRTLDLSYFNTTTTIDLYDILSYSKNLSKLFLADNHVSTANKSSVSNPPSQLIEMLDLSGCGITEFPELLRIQHEMELLIISHNKIEGQVPHWLWTLPNLTRLDISHNKMGGQVPGWLWTLPNLEYVNLSNNSFIGFQRSKKKQGLSSMRRKPSLIYLFGSNNNFTGKIPSFICELRSLNTLDLSENNFNGLIPCCLGNLESTLSHLNLRQNNLSGGLPKDIFESLRSLDVGHNQLVGKLPGSLNRFTALVVLNVESNRINDTFPFWLSSLRNLQVLVLRSNAFHGPIHQASFPQLRIIDISHNHFDGTLSSDYFLRWSAMLSVGTDEDRSSVNYMGSDYYSDSIVVMNKGIIMEMVRILTIFTAIDISGNKFEGEIPKSIGLLKELHVLNLSNNAFTGHIPSSMGNMKELESLDVSLNKLSGEIPQELGNLSYLAYMNFSHNQLSGLIPGGSQFRTQPCSSFENNMGLSGPSLDEDCRNSHTPVTEQYITPEPYEEDEEVISWMAAEIGLIPGITLGLTIGYIFLSYKRECFINPFARNNRRRRSTPTH